MNNLRKVYTLVAIAVILVACSGSEESNDQSTEILTDTTSVDTLTMADTIQIKVDPNRPQIDIAKLIDKASTAFELPLNIDSSFIAINCAMEEDADYNMTMQEAEYLRYSFVENNSTGNSTYDVTNFIFMDSLSQAGEEAYNDYQSSLDLGMTRYSVANVIGKAEVSEVSFLLFWFTDYATYEACPYGWGTCLYATLFTKDVATNTVLIGEYSGGGDPPAWGDDLITSEITPEQILIKSRERWGEEDYDTGEEITEVRERESDIEITPYGMVTLENRGD